ncbi:MAG: chorismate synthase [Deferribacteres bacterium]|nr:chorismate synthase [Deferribacteres bacterium]
MNRLRFLTSGESHGRAVVCTVEGLPSNLSLSAEDIDRDLARRQKGFGRGGRMKIESDRVQILSGIRWGQTLGSPVTLLIENRDWANWQDVMGSEPGGQAQKGAGLQTADPRLRAVTRPRPGHADLCGALKYNHRDIRNVLERSSARETAARVAAGAAARKLLSVFNIKIISYVTEIGGIRSREPEGGRRADEKKLLSLFKKAEASPVRCPDKEAEEHIISRIKDALERGDTLGGVFEVAVLGLPVGLGSYVHWDRRLEARLSYAVMGIQAIKGVEIGNGFENAGKPGSEVMDEIYYRKQKGFYRKTNNAGGIEGGMSNGMPVILRAAMKPIPTLRSPLASVDIITRKRFMAAYERSDACAVPAASVIGEAVTALVIADSFLEKFGGDSMEEIRRNYEGYLKQIREF